MTNNGLGDIFNLIDRANACDPNLEDEGKGKKSPAALLYGVRMSERLEQFAPNATMALRIACRAQHLERWLLPRTSFANTKAGYYAWRNEQKARHAERVAELMKEAGYDAAQCQRVAALVRKEHLAEDAEAQTLEDVACQVFLEFYAASFAKAHDAAKVVSILRKTWRKMSPNGKQAALALPLEPSIKAALDQALG